MAVSNSYAAASDWSAMTRQLAGFGEPGEGVQAAMLRAHRQLNGQLSFRRIQSLWYGQARRVTADEADLIRARLADQQRQRRARLTAELQKLDAQIVVLEGCLEIARAAVCSGNAGSSGEKCDAYLEKPGREVSRTSG